MVYKQFVFTQNIRCDRPMVRFLIVRGSMFESDTMNDQERRTDGMISFVGFDPKVKR
jgi:hypothetical protein